MESGLQESVPTLPSPAEGQFDFDQENIRTNSPEDGYNIANERAGEQGGLHKGTNLHAGSQQQDLVSAQSATASDDDQSAGALPDSPAIADDVDVIEKEWVDKAKKIVADTKENPYEQERQVSQLQSNYLMKRYGKGIKSLD